MNINDVSDPELAQKKAQKYLGKNTQILLSTRKYKKYMILNPETNKYVHFGDMRYEDFLKHKDKTRRNAYLRRASNINGPWKDDKYSPNNLSINILW